MEVFISRYAQITYILNSTYIPCKDFLESGLTPFDRQYFTALKSHFIQQAKVLNVSNHPQAKRPKLDN
jgi:hypothetical protein